MANTYGYCDPTFTSVRDLLQQNIANNSEVGASLCVNIDGRNVIDLWGGHFDPERTKPWKKDTVTAVWSCSKVVCNLAALTLIDRGLLDPNENVAAYWPEFAARGKENVKVWQIMSHSSGVSGWEPPISWEDVFHLRKSTEKLAAQEPWWTPGERNGYHLVNQGHLIGEIVRRVSGKSLTQFISDELTTPLGADFQLGVSEKDWSRTADVIPPPPRDLEGVELNPVALKVYAGPPMDATISSTPAFRGAEIGGAGGFSNARALARIGSIVSLGGAVDGKKYLSADTIDKMMTEQISGHDMVTFLYIRYGLGVGLPVPQTFPFIPEGRICYWGGWGGSLMIMDRDRRMTIGYAMNNMGSAVIGNDRSQEYVEEIYKILDTLGSSPFSG